MSPRQRHSVGYACSTAALLLCAFMVAIAAPACVVEPVVGPEATATVGAVRKVQAKQALGAGIVMEDDSQISYAGVAYGSGLRYDPDNEELLARLASLRGKDALQAPLPTYTPGPTPVPLVPSDEVPDAELGLRQFGKVILSALPPREIVPPPLGVFSVDDQIAVYVETFKGKELIPFEMRFFDMSTRKLIFITRPNERSHGLARWYNNFVWYQKGEESPGSYRLEIYSLGRLTHILPYSVESSLPVKAAVVATTTATPAPSPALTPAPTQTPVPAPPRVVSVSPAAGAQGVAGDTTVKAVFNTPLDPDSLGDAALQLGYTTVGSDENRTSAPLPGRVSLGGDGLTLSFVPLAGALPGNAVLLASVSAGLRSTTGATTQEQHVWSFSTATYPASSDGRLSNGDFSLGLEGWNADVAGSATGFGGVAGMLEMDGNSIASISRAPGGGLDGMVGLFQNVGFQVPAGFDMSLMLNMFGGGNGTALRYILLATRGGEQFAKTGTLMEGNADNWTEASVDLTSGSDPLRPGDIVTRLGVYGTGEEFEYKLDEVRLGESAAPTAIPTPAPTQPAGPSPTADPPPPTRDGVQIASLDMVAVTSFSPGLATYLVTTNLSYSLGSSPSGVIRITPYEDDSNSGLNFLYEITVSKGAGTLTIAAPYVPRATSKHVRFQAYFRDASGKQIAESFTDSHQLQGR